MASKPKRPTAASLKKVTVENLVNLGVERLAELLAAAADTRPDLKRRLRMELAAEQGSDHLVVEIDRRLGSLDASHSKVSWRKRASFVSDLDILRTLIADRLAALDGVLGLERMWRFIDLSRRLGVRVKDRDGALATVFLRAAGDIGKMMADRRDMGAAEALVDAMGRDSAGWLDWLPVVLQSVAPSMVQSALARLQLRQGATSNDLALVRLLADAAGDIAAYRATFPDKAQLTAGAAAQIARRLLAVQDVEEAGRVLVEAQPTLHGSGPGLPDLDFEWESAWIDYLDQSGRAEEGQAVRWQSFERTLSVERARAFVKRLTGFDDVEAETRARDYAAGHADVEQGLRFLMTWPAHPEAAAMIMSRREDILMSADEAELWAGRLRGRHPAAAHILLRKAAAAAFKRRDFATCDRLTEDADALIAARRPTAE